MTSGTFPPNPMADASSMHGSILLPALLLALLWWTLAGAGVGDWVAGAIAIIAALLVHRALSSSAPSLRLHPLGAAAFIPWFLLRAFQGGLDVAIRAFSPGLPLAPATLHYRIRLPEGGSRTLFVNTISLLPGTFSADLSGDRVTVHLLARTEEAESTLAELEGKVGAIFGHELEPKEAAP